MSMHFTKEQIKEIYDLVMSASVKDSSFSLTDVLDGTEYVAILQDNKNVRVLVEELIKYSDKHISPTICAALGMLRNEVVYQNDLVEALSEMTQTINAFKVAVNTTLNGLITKVATLVTQVETIYDALNADDSDSDGGGE